MASSISSTSALSHTLALALVASTVALAQNEGTDAPANGTDPQSSSSSSSSSSSANAAAENAAGASGADTGGLSRTNSIIIGVVLGGVVLVAITAAILFFLAKKRQWDRQAERYEVIHAYRSQARARRYHELSLRQQRRGWDGDRDSPETSTLKSPLVESLLPVYDPSTYHRQQLHSHSASFDLPRRPVASHQHSSSQYNPSTMPPPPLPLQSTPSNSNQPLNSSTTTSSHMHTTSSGCSNSNGTSDAQSPPPPAAAASVVESGPGSAPRPPKRPKPVLARLITDL
ncbi:hypothetical protein VTN77DRAFT_4562 [Rasamsonia byssochlamydoides]|uniref:uncharacterized protein n=1 Tax=Rasamsonia byssochlamydoides TaxID=89139 RepID=UPI0037422EB0